MSDHILRYDYHTINALIKAHGAYYVSFWVRKGCNNLKESALLKEGPCFRFQI